MVTQQSVNAYVEGALRCPLKDKEQLVSMVILHFGIPDDKARDMVERSLEPPYWRVDDLSVGRESE